jgi:DNA-binding beta-propeller fold protein YncE
MMCCSTVIRRARAVVFTSLVLVCAGMLLDSAVASAGSRIVLGSPFGSFAYGTGVTVDQSTGNVYVVDGAGHEEIKVFGPEGGSPVGGGPSSFNGLGSPATAFNFKEEPAGPAYDSKNKVLYFPDVQNNLVDKYRLNGSNEYEFVCEITGAGQAGDACSASGGSPPTHFSEPLGVAVDSAGDVYVANFGPGRIWEYNAAGEQVAEIITPFTPQFLAVTATGTIYAIPYSNGPVFELKRSSLTGAVEKETELPGGRATGLAFDQATGDLIVDRGGSIEEFNAKREVVGTAEGVLSGGRGIAVNETTNDLYAVDNGGGNLVILVSPNPEAPSVSSESASFLSATSVKLGAVVNPNGYATSCQFEYIEDSAYQAALAAKASNPYAAGATVACSPATLEAQFAPVAVGATVSALNPGITYDFRAVASNTFKGASTTDGENVAFTMPTASSPSVQAEASLTATAESASVQARIDAKWAETTCAVQYVSDASFSAGGYTGAASRPCPTVIAANARNEVVSVTLTGLTFATKYHWRIMATNSQGATYGDASQGDQTFTTLPLAPLVGTAEVTAAPTGTSATVTVAINPYGNGIWDTTYTFEYGQSTAYVAHLGADAGSASGTATEKIILEDLQPNTTYHYQVVAVNASGTSYGADRTFTTPQVPPTATTVAAQSVNETSALLGGAANPEGSDTTCSVQYGTTSAYGSQAPLSPEEALAPVDVGSGSTEAGVPVLVSGLAPGTTYHYRFIATNSAGTSYGQDTTFTTTGTTRTTTFAALEIPNVPLIAVAPFAFPAEPGQSNEKPTKKKVTNKKAKGKRSHKAKKRKKKK